MGIKISGFFDSIGTLSEQIDFIKNENIKLISLSDDLIKFNEVDDAYIKKEIIPALKGVDLIAIKIKLPNDVDDFDNYLIDFNRILDVCDTLKCKNIIVDGLYLNEDKKEEKQHLVFEKYSYMADEASKFGICINVRHNPLTYLNTSSKIQSLIRINDKIKYAYEATSLHKTKELVLSGFRLMKKNIGIIIINDCNDDFINVPIGLGVTKPFDYLRTFSTTDQSFVTIIESNMDYYYNRDIYYKKSKNPFFKMSSKNKEFKAIKMIDESIGKDSNSEVTPNYIETVQIRFLKKMIEKI